MSGPHADLPGPTSRPAHRMLRVAVIDTGINPWHSHVGGKVAGCRVYLDGTGRICEDDDFRDLAGHGTAVAGVLRQECPELDLFAVRAFDADFRSYPSLVARAVLRAAAEGCSVLNLSLGMKPGPGCDVLAAACRSALAAGCTLVAAGLPGLPDLLPAALPGTVSVVADDRVPPGETWNDPSGIYHYRASGRPRDLDWVPSGENFWGNSFACARVAAHLATRQAL